MRTSLTGAAAAALLTAVATFGAVAPADARVPVRTRVYALPPGLDAEEVRDYQYDQLERRQEVQREALYFRQKVQRRWLDPDEDD